jgi:CheY-like chemotaxis protein
VPIVALTANVCPEDAALCAEAGMNGILGKPVALADLLDALARYAWPFRSGRDQLDAEISVRPAIASPVLSATRLKELRGMLPADNLASLVEECLADLSERMVALRHALDQQAGDEIYAVAHAMAGMAAGYGMAALEARLRALMRQARDEPGAGAAQAEELEVEIFTAGAALREALQIEMV